MPEGAMGRAKGAQGLADALGDEGPPAGVRTVDPAVGRAPAPATANKRKPKERKLWVSSVAWDLDYADRLRAILVGERGVTIRSIHNILLKRWVDMPAAERRELFEEALEWEREMKP